jgi:outer membrane protein assembly factor BamB
LSLRRSWAAFVAVGLSVATPARADDWPTFGLDGAQSRLTSERSGAAFADGRWLLAPPTDAGVLASPVVADGYVVSAALDGTVSALAADTGKAVWQVSVGASVQATPAIVGGRVFVPTQSGKVIALALADGAALWSTNLGGSIVSSPALVGSDLIVGAGTSQQFLARLDAATGAIVWQTLPVMQGLGQSSPAMAGGMVVVGTNGGHFYAFDPDAGLALWDYGAAGLVDVTAPLIVGGDVYLVGGATSGQVYAVSAATGTPVAGWPIDLPALDPDLSGTMISRSRAVSAFAAAGGLLILETRLDDALDTDGNGAADQALSREWAIALDPTAGTVVWQRLLGRVVFGSPNDLPSFAVSPTPAAFGTDGGGTLVAVASSLVGTVSVLDARTGSDQGDLTMAGPALASPVMANGRLITVAADGTVEGRLSGVNHPPTAPVLAANPRPLDAADVTLHWAAATDLDGEQPTYELRLDSDGEVLMSYAQQIFPAQGATSLGVTVPLAPGVTYTVAMRARDSHGAFSPWSAPEKFTVVAPGVVTVHGTPAANLRSAVASAQPGDVVQLGEGTYPLSGTLQVGAGVSLRGAGAGRTILDATGLSVGVSFTGTDASTPAGFDGATVAGAMTCLAIGGDATGVRLSHLVVRDCSTAGIAVAAGGGAAIANATLSGNGAGVDAVGATTIKNSLITGNDVGLKAEGAAALASSYDDLFGNTTPYAGLTAGTGDLAQAVTFVDLGGHNFLLPGPEASTDQGDPADDVGQEPTPNGGRINLGAFGGTADAELSVPGAVTGGPGAAPAPSTPTAIPPAGSTPGQIAAGGSEGCALGGGRPSARATSWMLVLLALALARRHRSRRS